MAAIAYGFSCCWLRGGSEGGAGAAEIAKSDKRAFVVRCRPYTWRIIIVSSLCEWLQRLSHGNGRCRVEVEVRDLKKVWIDMGISLVE